MLLKKGNEKTQQTNREELAKSIWRAKVIFLPYHFKEKARDRRSELEGHLFADFLKNHFLITL